MKKEPKAPRTLLIEIHTRVKFVIYASTCITIDFCCMTPNLRFCAICEIIATLGNCSKNHSSLDLEMISIIASFFAILKAFFCARGKALDSQRCPMRIE